MSRLGKLWSVLRGGPRTHSARFAVRFETDGAVTLNATAPPGRLVPVVLNQVGDWSGPVGMAMVVYRPEPEEWVAAGVPRARALEGLLHIRDLIGAGGLDLAMFSELEALSIYVDRFGLLEARGLGDGVAGLGARLAAAGFTKVARVSTIPRVPIPGYVWSDEDRTRVSGVVELLQLVEAQPEATRAGPGSES